MGVCRLRKFNTVEEVSLFPRSGWPIEELEPEASFTRLLSTLLSILTFLCAVCCAYTCAWLPHMVKIYLLLSSPFPLMVWAEPIVYCVLHSSKHCFTPPLAKLAAVYAIYQFLLSWFPPPPYIFLIMISLAGLEELSQHISGSTALTPVEVVQQLRVFDIDNANVSAGQRPADKLASWLIVVQRQGMRVQKRHVKHATPLGSFDFSFSSYDQMT